MDAWSVIVTSNVYEKSFKIEKAIDPKISGPCIRLLTFISTTKNQIHRGNNPLFQNILKVILTSGIHNPTKLILRLINDVMNDESLDVSIGDHSDLIQTAVSILSCIAILSIISIFGIFCLVILSLKYKLPR